MDKIIFSSLTFDDLRQLVSLSSYLLSIDTEKDKSSISDEDYFITTEPLAFSVDDIALLRKLKHLHCLKFREYDKA